MLSNKLYHATIKQNLPSIKRLGLGAKIPYTRFWDYEGTEYENVKQGCFLDTDIDNAYSYLEGSDSLYDAGYDEDDIVVLSIDTAVLDRNLLEIDENDLKNFEDDLSSISYFYRGVIPWSAIKIEKYEP